MIPQDTLAAIDRYVQTGDTGGSFLAAVLENNLKESVARADMRNLAALVGIVSHLYNNVPARCWGSPENVQLWSKIKQATPA